MALKSGAEGSSVDVNMQHMQVSGRGARVVVGVVVVVVVVVADFQPQACNAHAHQAQRRSAVDAHQATIASLRLEVRSLRRTLSEKNK